MRRSSLAIATILAFFLTALAWAQEDQHEQPNPQQQEQKVQKPEKEEKPSKEQKQEHEMHGQEQSNPAHEEHGNKSDKYDRNDEARGGEHGRPAGRSAHIPDDKFRAHFGREHHFTVTHVVHETRIVPGRTNFVYGGYTFVFVDPWPTEWLYTDDCYVDFIDGEYFLFDVMHPGVRITLFVQG